MAAIREMFDLLVMGDGMSPTYNPLPMTFRDAMCYASIVIFVV